MLIDPTSTRDGSWDTDPANDWTMLALQYIVALIAFGAAGLLGSVH